MAVQMKVSLPNIKKRKSFNALVTNFDNDKSLFNSCRQLLKSGACNA